jgi:hypothetical protein
MGERGSHRLNEWPKIGSTITLPHACKSTQGLASCSKGPDRRHGREPLSAL